MSPFAKRLLIGTLITFAASLIVAALIYVLFSLIDLGNGNTFTQNTMNNVANGLSLSGLFGVLIFLLGWLSGEGAFDIIAYSFKLAFYNTFRRNVRKTALPASYAEYKELKHGEKKESILFLFIGSLPCLIVGTTLAFAYYLS